MTLNEEQLLSNWEQFLDYIKTYITGDRKQRLLDFYNKYEERFILLPASHKPQYHNCFPGGYIEHVNRVVSASIEIDKIWRQFEVKDTYTLEEVVFSALNHDLGKFGSLEHEAVLPNPSEWHVKNRGEIYTFNTQLDYMTVPDRGLWLLNQLGIEISKNEYLAIKLHDGLYDESNKPYLISWAPETKLRTSLPYIIHQADLLAARVEFERENLDKFNTTPVDKPKPITSTSTYVKPKQVSLDSIAPNVNLKNIMDTFFE
jgi:hypothetical protein